MNSIIILIFYCEQYSFFQTAHSTEHAILQLVSQLSHSFDKNKFMLQIFTDLSKRSDTIYHKILKENLELNVIKGPTFGGLKVTY